ncbi:TetR/AcrR family transcriptional regulator [Kitasatospora gansuensis]
MSKPPVTPARSKRVGAQLTPEAIIDASLRIAARGSADAFTVRRLGEELGTDPTAIYRHYRDKDELLLSVADRTLGEVLDSIPPGLGWQDRLRALADGSLAVALKYPAVSSAMASRTTRRANEFRVVELILGAVREAAWTASTRPSTTGWSATRCWPTSASGPPTCSSTRRSGPVTSPPGAASTAWSTPRGSRTSPAWAGSWPR